MSTLLADRRGRTMHVIAHRPSMVQIADHVFVLEGGRIAEEGTPLVLREAGGWFSRFVRTTHSDEATSSSTTAARPNLAEEKPDGGIQKHIDALIDDRPC